ncbi:hypothetical protein PA598K_02132 [Paenibacillus sp. 598K]|uniref:hypothetical protein n=1 Tax=Paenibacillus sp. 598K TaxID=1117987 RepID=UPI000FFAB90F|nr:hypothetical protein [Paenibacillus sp. 598K]GBF73811.1 hypothetical protein PA598K_02132 [Paenibacillus sp. 598K]
MRRLRGPLGERGLLRLVIALALSALVMTGCSRTNGINAPVPGEQEATVGQTALAAEPEAASALAMLTERGYRVQSAFGKAASYVLEPHLMTTEPYRSVWAVQEVKPEAYWGQTVAAHSFVVSDHPLEQTYASLFASRDYETVVTVLCVDGLAIGGVSSPVDKDGALMLGGTYSLDGKTLEEVTGGSYEEWLTKWQAMYGDANE